ncbi:caskin-1 [Choloepus didactylus]|uniref:caskin-1 n=1 Tax=Choloepus didactylus TaxID=27675 RepID=UPI00189CF575|nr:caskin-1 [Choloepus didactylus]
MAGLPRRARTGPGSWAAGDQSEHLEKREVRGVQGLPSVYEGARVSRRCEMGPMAPILEVGTVRLCEARVHASQRRRALGGCGARAPLPAPRGRQGAVAPGTPALPQGRAAHAWGGGPAGAESRALPPRMRTRRAADLKGGGAVRWIPKLPLCSADRPAASRPSSRGLRTLHAAPHSAVAQDGGRSRSESLEADAERRVIDGPSGRDQRAGRRRLQGGPLAARGGRSRGPSHSPGLGPGAGPAGLLRPARRGTGLREETRLWDHPRAQGQTGWVGSRPLCRSCSQMARCQAPAWACPGHECLCLAAGSRAGPEPSPPQGSSSLGPSAPPEEIWVLRKPFAGGDRSSSLSGMAGGRAPHATSEGVKLLATVLSQKSVSETSPGDGSVKPPEVSAGVARPQPPAAQTGQVYGEQPPKKLEPASEGKSAEAVSQWLTTFQLQLYAPNFVSAGYDLPTISRMTPEDLTAIGVTKPGHRKKITAEISGLSIPDWLPEHKPANLAVWLSMIGLAQYYKVLVDNGYESVDFITDITWEDLQEIGITKLGHQKKLMLAVRKLAELQKAEYAKYEGGPLHRKAPQSLEVMAIESPPPPEPVPADCQSPKMSTFQDSELSGELQAAMTGPAEGAATAATEKPSNHLPPTPRGAPRQEASLSRRARHLSSSQELLGDGPPGPGSPMSRSQEHLLGEGQGPGTPPKEARAGRHGHSVKRASVPPVPGKPRPVLPPGTSHFTPPQTPTKTHPGSPQALGGPHGPTPATAKVKPTPQLLTPAERPMSPRSLPQSPTHRGFAYVLPQPVEGEAGPPTPAPVPTLCLPPEADGELERPKKRAHSLNRYVASDSEPERDELLVPAAAGPYATVQRRVGRSHSVRAPAGADKNVNRSQSFAVRPRKKGPPPPPPKRSSSAMAGANLADEPAPDAEPDGLQGGLGVQAQRRRASDLAGSVDTGSAGSVKSIAAMLELSSIGGGGRAARRPPEGHPTPRPASPEPGHVAPALASVKHKETIGPDGEVVNRRRTLSGPVTGLLATARRGPGELAAPADPGALAEDGTARQRPRGPARGEGGGEGPPLARVEASATLKRRIRAKQSQQESVKFVLTESDTVKRRPKAKEREAGPEPPPVLAVYQNGMGTVRRRPASEQPAPPELPPPPPPAEPPPAELAPLPPLPLPDGDARKPAKPPVSPKPVLAQPVPKVQGSPTPASKRVPLPGPGSPEVKRAHGTPPPVSPKPPPPPTAPKPAKAAAGLPQGSASPSPAPSPARQPPAALAKPAGTPPPLSAGPAAPPSPGAPALHVPAKPPRAAAAAAGTSAGAAAAGTPAGTPAAPDGASPGDSARQKLEETSACLAAALQAVEEKIRQEDAQGARPAAAEKSTGSILDDIGSMFDDLADQLDAMLE